MRWWNPKTHHTVRLRRSDLFPPPKLYINRRGLIHSCWLSGLYLEPVFRYQANPISSFPYNIVYIYSILSNIPEPTTNDRSHPRDVRAECSNLSILQNTVTYLDRGETFSKVAAFAGSFEFGCTEREISCQLHCYLPTVLLGIRRHQC
jgi:hypothetical protein